MVLAARWFACSCILELACDFLAVLGVSLFAVLVPCYRSRLACGQLQVFLIFGNREGCEVLVQILERSWLSVVISGIFFLLGNLAGLFVTIFISAVSFGSFCGLVIKVP
jgi:predicted secreted protein